MMPRKRFSITLDYPPALNRLWRNCRGRTVLSEEGRSYKLNVATLARAKRCPLLTCDVAVEVKVFRPRKARDLDANFKVLFDALNGIAWQDDSQITEIHAYRFEDKQNPRVELTRAVGWRLLRENPASFVELPKRQAREPIPVSTGDARLFLAAAKTDAHFPLFALAIETGLRPSEQAGLLRSDVDLDRKVISVRRKLVWLRDGGFVIEETKTTRSRRSIPISDELAAVLREHLTR